MTKALGEVRHRPTVMPVPVFALRLLYGEMGVTLATESLRAVPEKLHEAGFEWRYPELLPAPAGGARLMADVDVAVVGAGLAGLACARPCTGPADAWWSSRPATPSAVASAPTRSTGTGSTAGSRSC